MADKSKAVEGEIVKNEIAVLLDEQGVTENNIRSEIVEAFGGPFSEAGQILANFSTDEEGQLVLGENAIKITSVDQVEDMKEARAQRLALREARVTIENNRKKLKDESLKRGQAIDATARALKQIIEPAEKYLEEQEKFSVLKAAAEKAERFAARTAAIAKFADPDLYNLNDMEEEAFQELLIKLDKEAAATAEAERAELERQEAERKAEEKRQADIAAENERLRKQAEEQETLNQRKLDRVNRLVQYGMTWDAEVKAYVRFDQKITADDITNLNTDKWDILYDNTVTEIQKQIDAEHKKRVAEQQAAEEQQRKERAAAEVERIKREELEKAEADRKAAEEKAAAEKAAAEHQALLAPDKDKLVALMSQIDGFRTENIPAVKSKEAQAVINIVDEKLIGLIATIKEQVEKM